MKRLFLLAAFILSFIPAKADEGMWLMMLIKRLNGVDMQKQGLKLTPEEIYSVNNQPPLWIWFYRCAFYSTERPLD